MLQSYTSKLDKYRFRATVQKRYPRLNISFQSLSYLTRGPAETALIAAKLLTSSTASTAVAGRRPFVILDCDSFFEQAAKSDILSIARRAANSPPRLKP
jgi:hypothetical protein